MLDNLVRKEVLILAAEGKPTGRHPLGGDPAAATGVYRVEAGDPRGIWVDLGDRSQRIAYLDGNPDRNRISVPGKWSRDGNRLIRAEKIGNTTAAVYRSPDGGGSAKQSLVSFDKYLDHLSDVWDDTLGRIYPGAFLMEEPEASNTVVALDEEGWEAGRAQLWVQRAEHKIYRAFRVSPDGHIYQMEIDRGDVFIRRYGAIR